MVLTHKIGARTGNNREENIRKKIRLPSRGVKFWREIESSEQERRFAKMG